MVQELLIAVVAAVSAGAVYTAAAARVVKQYERGVVLRLGRLRNDIRGPGFTMVLPGVERLRKVNMQIVTMPVPAQDGITRDNVTVRVDAVIYFKVVDAASAVVEVEDYRFAVSQMAQTSLRSIIGKSDLDDLLSNREKLNQGLELMIDSPAVGWGVQIDRVEIKDVSLPETMKRSMARQAEADRERRARVINADAELQASKKLAEAASEMSSQPAALQLRLLQTVVAVAAEKNSTLVLPFPVELLRFLERAQQPAQQQQQIAQQQQQQQQPAQKQPAQQHSAQQLVQQQQQADPDQPVPQSVDRAPDQHPGDRGPEASSGPAEPAPPAPSEPPAPGPGRLRPAAPTKSAPASGRPRPTGSKPLARH
ncbi:slipin family protein [Streptomyces sp. NPDC002809]|uniref:slipin family protein n=1 Tax=Streptomyces sp. NPDC002809 TaxID=3154433 RepID=UPI003319AC30